MASVKCCFYTNVEFSLQWFWGSIQIEAKAAESMYLFQRVEYPKMLTRSSTTSSLLGMPLFYIYGACLLSEVFKTLKCLTLGTFYPQIATATVGTLALVAPYPPIKKNSDS